MSTPEQNQALAVEGITQTVSEPQDVALSASEVSVSDTWKVPQLLNDFWSATQAEREQVLSKIEHEVSAVGGFSTTYQDINVQSTGIAMPRTIMAGGAIASILRTIGQSIKDDIIMAQQYAKDDELVASHLRCKNLFFPSGFGVSIQNEKKRAAFKSFSRNPRINIRKVCRDGMEDWNATDNLVLIWSVDDASNEVAFLTAMDPSRCVYRNHDGQDRLDVLLDNEAMREITSYINTGGPKQDGVSQGEIPIYPERWKEAAAKGGALRLDRSVGDGWAIVTRAHKYNGFARPAMRTVFFDLMIRDLLKAGEWACAVFVQNCIQHITIGPKDFDVKVGPRAGQKDYPHQRIMNALNLKFQTPSRAARLITDSTVEIKYVMPDPETFTKKKFESCDSRIDEWGGVPEPIRTGKGDGYAQGFLGQKRFEADGLDARSALEEAFDIFFCDPEVRHSRSLKLADSDEVAYTWNHQILKDPKQLLEEQKFMWNSGLIDPRTIHEESGRDHDTIRARMEEYHKDMVDGKTIWMPDFEAKQGLLAGEKEPAAGGSGDAGRPSEGGPSGRRPRVALSSFGRGGV